MSYPRVLTLIADRRTGSLTATQIGLAREMISGGEPSMLADGEAVDIPCPAAAFSQPTTERIRAALAPAAIDAVFTRARGRRKGLLVADMDSTIVANETLDDLADIAGFGAQVAAITARSMNGEIDFAAALRERVALLRGLSVEALERTFASTRLTPGARTLVATMRAHNARCALVSGGFTWFTSRVAASCGFDEHHANRLQEADGKLLGTVGEPVLGRAAKREILTRLAAERGLRPQATLAIGDGANDLDMLGAAGLGLGFHAKPVVRAAIETRVDHADLRAALFVQGYPARMFAAE